MPDKFQEEVDRNFERFRELLPAIPKEEWGRFALMRAGEIVQYFDSARDAHAAGEGMFDGEPFSVQEVTDRTVDLGFYSYAHPVR